MSLMEVMVALGVGSIVLITGLHVLSLMLEALVQDGIRRVESISIQSELNQLRDALDTMVQNPFEENVVLEIETDFHNPDLRLTRLGIPAEARANRKSWQWEAPGKYRILVERGREVETTPMDLFPLFLRFPDSVNPRFREGVAIHGNW